MEFESRESFRVGSENFISFRLFNEDGQVISEGMATTIDISRTGIAIKTKSEMEPNLNVELTIAVGDDIVKTAGVIKNRKNLSETEFQIGVEFNFLSDQDLDKLATIYPDINK